MKPDLMAGSLQGGAPDLVASSDISASVWVTSSASSSMSTAAGAPGHRELMEDTILLKMILFWRGFNLV